MQTYKEGWEQGGMGAAPAPADDELFGTKKQVISVTEQVEHNL